MKFIKFKKNYLRKKKQIFKQENHSIPNIELISPDKKTIVFVLNSIPTFDHDSGSNRLKEIIIAYKKLDYNCILSIENIYEQDKYVEFFTTIGVIIYIETSKYQNYLHFLKTLNKIDYLWFSGPDNLNKYFEKLVNVFPAASAAVILSCI